VPFLIEHTPQEAVNAVVRGAHAQGWRKSEDGKGLCMYRNPYGLKCHAGHLMSDEFARANNCTSIEGLIAGEAITLKHERVKEVLWAVQAAHDGNFSDTIHAETWRTVRDLELQWPDDVPTPDGLGT
jgi:hypothetical protein